MDTILVKFVFEYFFPFWMSVHFLHTAMVGRFLPWWLHSVTSRTLAYMAKTPPAHCHAFNLCILIVSHLELPFIKVWGSVKGPVVRYSLLQLSVLRKHFGFSGRFIENTVTVSVGLPPPPGFFSLSGLELSLMLELHHLLYICMNYWRPIKSSPAVFFFSRLLQML